MGHIPHHKSVIELLVVWTIASPCLAEEATVFISGSAVNRDVVEYVASVAEPIRVNVTLGQTLGDVIRFSCGYIDDDYVAYLNRFHLRDLGSDIQLDREFEAETTITLPACIELPQYGVERRIVKKGEAPWHYYEEDNAGFDRFIPASARSQESYLDAFVTLNDDYSVTPIIFEGKEVFVPTSAAAWSSLDILENKAQSIDEISEISRILNELLMAAGQNPEQTAIEDPEEIEIFSEMSLPELRAIGACNEGENAETRSAPPINVPAIMAILARNLDHLGDLDKGPDRATIVIPDTGLHTTGRRPFSVGRVNNKGRPANARDEYEGIRPYLDHHKHQHGTYVASLALGGPAFMKVLDSTGIDLDVAPINIVRQKDIACLLDGAVAVCPTYPVRADVFNNMISFAGDIRAVVNLSVGRQVKFTAIEKALSKDSRVLFVVAAGNSGKSLTERRVYPALYGGGNDGRYNLITVAALDVNGFLAPFSNHGAAFVDIAAPGCLQEVYAYDSGQEAYRLVKVSGTSFATPWVSFVAALLKAVWLDATPRALKRRILTSADIDGKLPRAQVADSRKLNIVKALSVYDDVVEGTIDGETRLIHGDIASDQEIFELCEGRHSLFRSPGVNRNVVKKIAAIPGPEPKFLIYWLTPDGVLNQDECRRNSLTIKIRDRYTNWFFEFDENSLVDVVFAEP